MRRRPYQQVAYTMSATLTPAEIIPNLKGVKQTGRDKWMALCPAHEDSSPSLSVGVGDGGRLLLNCFAGCAFEAILDASGVPRNGSNQNGRPLTPISPQRKIVATHDYKDQGGNVLFQKVRYKPKSFAVRRPDGAGGWHWDLGGIAPVLYNLPQLVASPPMSAVYVVEGEKDADRLSALGLVATCNFDGASADGQRPKWRAAYKPYFAKRIIYILADNDKPGRAHAAAVAASLASVAQAVKVVQLPGLAESGDASDWLDAGGSVQELATICLRTALWTEPPAAAKESGAAIHTEALYVPQPKPLLELLGQEFAPLEFLLDGILAKGHLAMLGGRPKSGKSWLTLQLAQAVDEGRSFLGKNTGRGRVLYIALEDGERRVYQRCKVLRWRAKWAAVLFAIANFDGDGVPGPGLAQIAALTAHYDLIIIDTLIATLSSKANENDNTQMGAVVNELARIAHDSNTAILLVHHTGKGQAENVFDLLRGASAIRGGYDVGLVLERKQGEREAVLYMESRDTDLADMTIRHAADGAGWECLGGGAEIFKIRAGRKVVQTLTSHGDGVTAEELAGVMRISYAAVHKQLLNAERDNLVCRRPEDSPDSDKPADLWYLKEGGGEGVNI